MPRYFLAPHHLERTLKRAILQDSIDRAVSLGILWTFTQEDRDNHLNSINWIPGIRRSGKTPGIAIGFSKIHIPDSAQSSNVRGRHLFGCGTVRQHFRYRPDERDPGDPKYLSAKDSDLGLFIPEPLLGGLSMDRPNAESWEHRHLFHGDARLLDPRETLLICESEFKAWAATCAGFVAVGLSGVSTGVRRDGKLIDELEYLIRPDLTPGTPPRRVVILFDAGANISLSVQRDEQTLANAIHQAMRFGGEA